MLQKGTVWLIGADSFTGSYLLPALAEQGYSVDITLVDITDSAAVHSAMLSIQPDYIINLAGISFVPDGVCTAIYNVNSFGPQYILDAALSVTNKPKRIILASSANVYGPQAKEQIDEQSVANPVNHYGCSKWTMEQIAKTYADRLNITITRPFNYTGVAQEDKFLIPKIVTHFKSRSKTISLGNIDIARDFSDVRWVAQAYIALLTSDESFSVVNLCSGLATSIRDVIEGLQQLAGYEIEVNVDQRFVRENDIKQQCGDNNELFRLCPELDKPVVLAETLKWMYEDVKLIN